ncbi:hypothetical protein CAPTEDRAFT_19278 [Capitella teleta]|uniref:Uncharacterized protein n=1 Tax=Capitella teleta TaxID=283909 RepID=R7TD04_CAPTE|nr:hypothetical protein CAPTEDRAFT_19278 [Capitella teleta]|eukprot:ELT91357.1 hypothetical protein CAPTEDRAFT_19278 [Capitella teleta]
MENIALVSVKVPYRPSVAGDRVGRRVYPPPLANAKPIATTPKPTSAEPTLVAKFLGAGMAACIGDLVTFPLDTAKVRLQIQGEASIGVAAAAVASSRSKKGRSAQSLAKEAAKGPKYRGMVGTLLVIKREEGVRSLYSGLSAGLQRQMAFGAIRIGLYDSVKQGYINLFQANGLVSQHNVGLRILAGVTTGGAAVLFAQPTDVVKVRLQAQGTKGPRRYTGCINAYRTIGAEEGMRGLWRGALPNITRNAIVNATELVSYDLIKEAIVRHHLLSDNMPCHFVSAFGAGFCTTVIASPVDVVKTRFMNSSSGVYKGAFDCARTMFREGGVQAFYKGFMPSFMRLGSWNIVMFVSYEQIKRGVLFKGFT